MKQKWFMVVAVLLIVGLAAACGGGGGSSSPGSGSLTGTWFGVFADSSNNPHTIEITVNSNNTMTGQKIDGTSTGVTYTVASLPNGPQLYRMTGSDGSTGGFYVDGGYAHAAFLDDNGSIGVVQKGATSLPASYAATDIVGAWSGFEVELNSNFDITDTYPSSAVVNSSYVISGSNKHGAFTGSFTAYGSVWGYYEGTVTASGVTNNVLQFLTPDKQFGGGYACYGSSVDTCTFNAWNKQ